jgi:AcrR family transcriptional regulator
MGLRERNRRTAMREVQAVALDLFERRGFDRVPVEEIASRAGVSPSTVYRHFGTKESLVTWDERDAVMERELTGRLWRGEDILSAVENSAVEAYARRADLVDFRRRLRLLITNEAVHAAAIAQDLQDRAELAKGFAAARGSRKPSVTDQVRAGACVEAIDVALEHWQRGTAADPEHLIHEAFAALTFRAR